MSEVESASESIKSIGGGVTTPPARYCSINRICTSLFCNRIGTLAANGSKTSFPVIGVGVVSLSLLLDERDSTEEELFPPSLVLELFLLSTLLLLLSPPPKMTESLLSLLFALVLVLAPP